MVKLSDFKEKVKEHGRKAVVATGAAVSVIAPASAAQLNETITPMVDDVVLMMPSMQSLVIAFAGILITVSVVGFFTGAFDKLLDGLNIGRRGMR
ncbi:hypothetical protein SAMN04488589_0504 [Methanolobus vulcani]|uniref:Uncharacterized protein n=1 Tax=Methanolobus vulcani TaxID=38026 RepID=A0A7Z7AXD5_9EURY|nr:hypothetical protein [Methanolobus vulcani]SDF43341.1 hypothetical protein SAMN04488589_0504 [Methanolobus vulcani]